MTEHGEQGGGERIGVVSRHTDKKTCLGMSTSAALTPDHFDAE